MLKIDFKKLAQSSTDIIRFFLQNVDLAEYDEIPELLKSFRQKLIKEKNSYRNFVNFEKLTLK